MSAPYAFLDEKIGCACTCVRVFIYVLIFEDVTSVLFIFARDVFAFHRFDLSVERSQFNWHSYPGSIEFERCQYLINNYWVSI